MAPGPGIRQKNPLIFCCSEENNLFRTLRESGISIQRFDKIDEALQQPPEGAGLFILSDRYPSPEHELSETHLQEIKRKYLKLYIEYPQKFLGLTVGCPQSTQKERVVVTSEFFSPVEPMTIMVMHDCWYVPLYLPENAVVHLELAKVAGYDRSVYGLPDYTIPLLIECPNWNILVASSALSNCIRGRYSPVAYWHTVWKCILSWAGYPQDAAVLEWKPTVSTQWSKEGTLPQNAEMQTLLRSMQWIRGQALYSIGSKKGAIEGFESNIRYDGKQLIRAWLRPDCIAESAMALAFDYMIQGNPDSKQLAESMLDSVWFDRSFYNDKPEQSDYGLVNWYDRRQVFYGDDNARVILATLAAGIALNNDRWDERVLTCLLANLRTTGSDGFRRPYLESIKSFANGYDWRFYQNESYIDLSPHYQCYLWACFLWAYALTGYEPFLKSAKKAIRRTMEATPSNWKWTNGLTQEIARMTLPLSWLIEIEDTEEHRAWLTKITEMLLSRMEPCGAIRDMLGPIENGRYPPPLSNEEYGLHEASLMQEDGDPVCDLLYTANWALLGLQEAGATTGDAALKEASDRLTAFLCRIQIRSEIHPFLDGAWMRSFDYVKWEYWGSSADNGWGPWCIETGWTNSWIASILSMRLKGIRLFDLQKTKSFYKMIPQSLMDMGLVQS